MTYKPDYKQYNSLQLQLPRLQAPQPHRAGRAAAVAASAPVASSRAPSSSAAAVHLGQPSQAPTPPLGLGPVESRAHATPGTHSAPRQATPRPAPLPFPPCEHRLPPPPTSVQGGAIAMHPLPPARSASQSVTPRPTVTAPPHASQPPPSAPPPPPAASALLPFGPTAVLAPSAPLLPYSMGQHTLVVSSPVVPAPAPPGLFVVVSRGPPAPPSPVPVPLFVSTRPGMVPYGPHAPVLTPWPPIPLRHIDTYLSGGWPTAQQVGPMMATTPPPGIAPPLSFTESAGAATPHPYAPFHSAPMHLPAASSQAWAPGPPLSLRPDAGLVSPPPPPPPPPLSPLSNSVQSPTSVGPTFPTTPPDNCMTPDCHAQTFCELSPCHCRICRDHLGWVMRGARWVSLETGEEVATSSTHDAEPPGTARKMYRCTACGRQSAMDGSPPLHRSPKAPSSELVTSPTQSKTAAGETPASRNGGVSSGAFSIKYFRSGSALHAVRHQPEGQSTYSGLPEDSSVVGLGGDASLTPAGATLPFNGYPDVLSPEPVPSVSALPASAVGVPPKEDSARPPLAIETGAVTQRPRPQSIAAPLNVVETSVEIPPMSPPSRPASSPSALASPNPPETASPTNAMSGSPPSPKLAYGMVTPYPSPPYAASEAAQYGAFPLPSPNGPDPLYTITTGFPLSAESDSPTYALPTAPMYATIPTATPGSFPPGSVQVHPPIEAPGLTGMDSSFPFSPRSRWKKGGKRGGAKRFPSAQAPGSSGIAAITTPVSTPQRIALPPAVDGSMLERREWPIVKVENIPFNTTVSNLQMSLPKGLLPPASTVPAPIHIILHRSTGRTLPHCYIETSSRAAAEEYISKHDRTTLLDRTIRVKWERAGELLRDLFDQSLYFQEAHVSPAAAILPHLPAEGFRLPSRPLLTAEDIKHLQRFCLQPVNRRERPFERAYYNVASILSQFPWQRRDLWDDKLRNDLFNCVIDAIKFGCGFAREVCRGGDLFGYKRMVGTVNLTVQQCPALTPSQKEQARLALESGLSNAPPTRAPPPDQPGAQEFPPLQSVEGGAATSPQTPPASSSNSLEPESPETPTPRPRHGAATSLLTGRPIEIKTGLPTRAAAPKSGTASDATSAGLPKSYRLALATPVSRARALNSGSSLICEAGASRIIPVSGVPTRSSQKGAGVPFASEFATRPPVSQSPPRARKELGAENGTPSRGGHLPQGWLATPPDSPLANKTRQFPIPSGSGGPGKRPSAGARGWAED